jgi:hypothetical protein
MNSEFEWRNQMRKLDQPVEPDRDLWPSIAARIASEAAPMQAATRRRHLGWLAIAATVIVAVGAALTAYRLPNVAAPQLSPSMTAIPPAPVPAMMASEEVPRTALDWAIPADPQLAATAQRLDNASAQLQDALEQRPDAVFLVGLLNRTNAQRLRLLRKPPYAG